ncbi:MAG: transglycosylase domain-containing protein, partial [Gemmatimonadetes bacterium]|nr:transglycosylase domain-containing protein [Gemmatimonadota bacterium]
MRARRSAAAARLRKLLVRAREGVRRLLPARAARALDRAARFRLRRPTVREALFGVAILLLLLWVAWERCGMRGCPNVERLASYQPGGASVLLDRAGRPFADLAPVERAVVSLDSLPAYVADAFIAVEDKRFYQHTGVDWRRVVGAALADLRARGFVQGFSTITMQLARNVFPDRLPGARRTLKRKLLEIRVAREIEGKFSKGEILELYLNHIYFGRGAYGIEAAAQHYFRRPARRLTLAQAALLAALPKSPSTYDPRRYAESARGRRNLVLALMAEQGRVHAEEAESARAARLGVRREPPPRQEPAGLGPYFAEVVRRELEDRFGDLVYTAPLRIRTSLDRRFQQAAEEELSRQLRAIEAGAFGRFHGPRYRRELEAGAE